MSHQVQETFSDGCEDKSIVLVAGEALYDIVLDGLDQLRGHPGGGPFNTARAIGRLGQPVAFLGRLSTDSLGRALVEMLTSDGVLSDAVVRTDEPTTLALAEVDASGSATYRFYEGASVGGLTPTEALAALPANVGILHVGTLGLVLEPIADALETLVRRLAGRALVAIDPNVRPWAIADPGAYRRRLQRIVGLSDVIKASQEDLAWLYPDAAPLAAARRLLADGPCVVLLTRGHEPGLVVTPEREHAIPVPPVRVMDTIGAGDAFGGGFLAWWNARGLGRADLADADLVVEATTVAALVAARTCERPGASPPFLHELGPLASAGTEPKSG